MTENNAAQPGLNDTIRAVFLEHGFTIKHGQTDLKPYVYEAVHALLSKLRAEGVQAADERAAFEAWALTEFTHPFMVPDPLIEDPDGSGDYVNRDVQMAWAGYQQARAALASAPVAGEAQSEAAKLAEELSDLASDMAYEANQEMDQDKASRAAIIERGERALHRFADAAPHASEADELIGALGQCRDAFPIPATAGSPLDLLWQEAMSDPAAVPAYVKACASNGQASEAVRAPDYTLQHADHMAVSAEQLMEAINARDAVIMQREESDDVDDETMQEQHENVSEFLSGMRNAIYEYRKRRNRALKTQADKDGGDCAKGAGAVAMRDAAFEAVRKRLCAIPRYSFYLDDDGVVRRVEGRSGNWIEFDAAHELFDPVAVDAALSPTPSAVKQSLTATQTGEKGESDAH